MSGFTDVTSYAASTPFTADQVVAIIRYCGYPAYSGYGWVFEGDYPTLLLRLQKMAPSEASVITTTYLPTLATLESGIPAAADNLDTDKAAVWTRNRTEVADRAGLFDDWRRRLCAFIGVQPGRGLRSAGALVRT